MKGWHNLQFKKPPRSDKYYLTVIKNDKDEFTHYNVTRWRYNEFIDLAIDITKHFCGSKIYWRELPKLPKRMLLNKQNKTNNNANNILKHINEIRMD